MEEDNRANLSLSATSSEGKQPRSDQGSNSNDGTAETPALLALFAVSKDKLTLNLSTPRGGSCGDVYRGTLHSEDVVVKTLRSRDKQKFNLEAEICLRLSHKNVVSVRGVCLDGPEPLDKCIIMEELPGGTLYDKISRGELDEGNVSPCPVSQDRQHEDHEDQSYTVPKIPIKSWMKKLEIARGAAHGLLYLHTKSDSVVHGDFYTTNLMISSEGITKIIDFGFSSYSGKELEDSNPRWQAPEVAVHRENTSFQSDIYSFGIVLWEILMDKHAWEELDEFYIHHQLEKNRIRPQVHGDLPQELPGVKEYVSIMKECWEEDPKQRPDMHKVVDCLDRIWSLAEKEQKKETKGREAGVEPQNPSQEQAQERDASVEIENPTRHHQPSPSKWVRFQGSLLVIVKKMFSCGYPRDLEQTVQASPLPLASADPVRPSPFSNPPVMLPIVEDNHEVNRSVASLPQNPRQSDANQELKAPHPNQAGLMEIRDFVIEAMESITSLQRSTTWRKVAYVVGGWDISGSGVTNEDWQRLLMEVHGGQASRDDAFKSAQAGHPWDELNKLIAKIMAPGLLRNLEDGKPPKLQRQSEIPKKNLELGGPAGDLLCPLANSF